MKICIVCDKNEVDDLLYGEITIKKEELSVCSTCRNRKFPKEESFRNYAEYWKNYKKGE